MQRISRRHAHTSMHSILIAVFRGFLYTLKLRSGQLSVIQPGRGSSESRRDWGTGKLTGAMFGEAIGGSGLGSEARSSDSTVEDAEEDDGEEEGGGGGEVAIS